MELKFDQIIEMLLTGIKKVEGEIKPVIEKILSQIMELAGPYREYLIWGVPILVATFFLLVLVKKRSGKKVKADAFAQKPVTEKLETREPVQEKQIEEAAAKKEVPLPEPPKEATGLLRNIRTGLEKTRKALSGSVDMIFSGGRKLDEEMLEELEELLITSDVGVKTTMDLVENISEKASNISNAHELKSVLKEEISKYINVKVPESANFESKPHVIMVVGVNGVGKTTTIGKLASRFSKEGKKVLIVAADTFRAAAADQLNVWAERSGAEIVKHKDNSDPAAVAFDGMEAAVARDVDIVIIDTAGRLHTKKNLMEELKKIERTVSNKIPEAPHETLMVVDATTGQNALTQAQLFHEAIGISGIALTKLDGTAKGGIVIGITNTLNVPLRYIGVGEQIEDLQDFDPTEFADALF